MTDTANPPCVQVDIVSDVVCPWCIVGYRQLEQALAMTGMAAMVRWHPFELNPQMPPEGQNLREHLMEKYGITQEASIAARERLTGLGASLGFTFNYGDDMRMVNTFRAHQLLDWALAQQKQHPLKLALFKAYFTDNLDVSDVDVLVSAAASVGLDGTAAREVLATGSHAEETRSRLNFWIQRGITGVPATIIGGKYLLSGAQGAENYAEALRRSAAEAA